MKVSAGDTSLYLFVTLCFLFFLAVTGDAIAGGIDKKTEPTGSAYTSNEPGDGYRGGPLTSTRLRTPDNLVLRGLWATFKPLDSYAHEDGIMITNGMFAHPGGDGPTEGIYYHDGSAALLSGYATVLDGLDYRGAAGSVNFMIVTDGQIVWQSGLISQKGAGKSFSVSLGGVKEIRLISTDGGNGTAEDWAAWVNMEVAAEGPALSEKSSSATVTGTTSEWPKADPSVERDSTFPDDLGEL